MDWLRAEVHHVLQTYPGLILERRAVDVVHERLTELVRQPWAARHEVGMPNPRTCAWTPPSAARTPRVGAMGWTSLSPSDITASPHSASAEPRARRDLVELARGVCTGIPFARKPSQRDAFLPSRATRRDVRFAARPGTGESPLLLRRSRAVRARDPLREQAPRFRQLRFPQLVVLGECPSPIRPGNLEIRVRPNRESREHGCILTPPGEANHPPSRTPDGRAYPTPRLFGRRDHVVPGTPHPTAGAHSARTSPARHALATDAGAKPTAHKITSSRGRFAARPPHPPASPDPPPPSLSRRPPQCLSS